MNEAEWLTCTESEQILQVLAKKASDRKLRLFAIEAARHSLQCFGHYDLDEVVDWAETCVEGQLVGEPSEAIRGAVEWATGEMCESLNCLGEAVRNMISRATFDYAVAQQTAKLIFEAHQIADVQSSAHNEAHKQCGFLRDIFGNPFRLVALAPAWLTSDVLLLARGIYTDRAFDRMPILADALQDAGCDNPDVLNHCRADGPHVRGCWVVDLLLGKA